MSDAPVGRSDTDCPEAAWDALRPLRGHRAFICLFVVSAMLSALALTYAYAERYRAEMTISFKPSDVTRLSGYSTQALGSPFPSANVPFKVITQTIAGLVETDTMLRRIVTDLHLDAEEPRDFSGPWYIRTWKELKSALSEYAADAWKLLKWGRIVEDDPVAKAITELRRQVKIHSSDSYLFSVQVTAKSPQRAAAIADELGTVLADLVHRGDLSSLHKEIEKIAGLRDEKLREIEEIETRMKALLSSNDVASVQEEIDKVTARASHLQQEKSDTQAELRQNEGTLAALREKLHANAPALSSRGSDAPVILRQAGSAGDDLNKPYSAELKADMAIGGLRARLEVIGQAITDAQRRLQALNEVSASYNLMSVQMQSLKRDFVALTDAYQEAQIRAARGQSELNIQAKAEAFAVPVSPIKIYHVLAAGVLAAMVSIGLAYVFDYFGIRVFVLSDRDRSVRPQTVVSSAIDGHGDIAAPTVRQQES